MWENYYPPLENSISGYWNDLTAGGHIHNQKFAYNPSYIINSSTDQEVLIELTAMKSSKSVSINYLTNCNKPTYKLKSDELV